MQKTIHPDAVALVKRSEGCRLKAYLCPAGVPTIGYGHTAGVKLGQTITETQAEIFLAQDLLAAAEPVDRLVTFPLTQRQRGALASFVFNLGADAFAGSTMLKLINRGELEAAAGEFGKWVKATVTDPTTKKKVKVTLPGLVTRRAEEAKLFLSDAGADMAVPQAVEPPAAMKPLSKSTTVQTGLGGIGIAAALTQARDVIDQAKEASETARGVLESLPAGPTGWLVAGILALAVGVMLYRRWHDARAAA